MYNTSFCLQLSGQMITDQPLEIFGAWQVEDYVPPTAENGIVPRNAFGNVELFKSCMLPKGTVHLQCEYLDILIFFSAFTVHNMLSLLQFSICYSYSLSQLFKAITNLLSFLILATFL